MNKELLDFSRALRYLSEPSGSPSIVIRINKYVTLNTDVIYEWKYTRVS